MRTLIALAALVFASGCASAVAPTTPPSAIAPTSLDYDINIPDPIIAEELQQQHPNGVLEPPIQAQFDWDYTAWYHGSPNVYYGPLGPAPNVYVGSGIVVAPALVAGKETFSSVDWPVLPAGVTYQWVGRFIYTAYRVGN